MDYSNTLDLLDKAKIELVNPPIGVPLYTWQNFSDALGGLRPGEFSLLCAPSGVGKTHFIAAMSIQLCLAKRPHFVAPVETGDTDFIARQWSVLSKTNLNSGDPQNELFLNRVLKETKPVFELTTQNIASYRDKVPLKEMTDMIRYQRERYNIEVALLDNLDFFMHVSDERQKNQEMDKAIHVLRILAEEIGVHIFLIVHPKKAGKGGRVESEEDIRGSSSAYQWASNVFLYNPPKEEELKDNARTPFHRELMIRKCRKRGWLRGVSFWFVYEDGELREV
jgi:replicative DNA helicase